MDKELKEKLKSDASLIANQYLNKEISLEEFLTRYPDNMEDFRVKQLFHLVKRIKKGTWYSSKSRRIYRRDSKRIQEILENLKSDRPNVKVMKTFIDQLRLSSREFNEPITAIWFPIMETAKYTAHPQEIIHKIYLRILLDYKIIVQTSKEPLLFEFTENRNLIGSEHKIIQLLESLPEQDYNI